LPLKPFPPRGQRAAVAPAVALAPALAPAANSSSASPWQALNNQPPFTSNSCNGGHDLRRWRRSGGALSAVASRNGVQSPRIQCQSEFGSELRIGARSCSGLWAGGVKTRSPPASIR
jgi:hypothetical protein